MLTLRPARALHLTTLKRLPVDEIHFSFLLFGTRMPTFSSHQDAALKAVADWLKAKPGRRDAPQIFRLFGYAGTGKTTLAKHVAEAVDGKVLYAAFTGKAAQVMRSKGCSGASTIHSLIYKALESEEETPNFELWDAAPASKAKLIVIDECSMVDAELGRDLMSFGVPLLVLGDPAQLPPISGGGFFTNAEPDVMLGEVHRQAQDDPIVRLSMEVREGKPTRARAIWCDRRGSTIRTRSQIGARRRSGPGRPQRDPPRLQSTHAYAARICEPDAGSGRQAGVPAQQPPQGAVQRQPMDREGARRNSTPDHQTSTRLRRGGWTWREGVGAAGMFHR